MARNSGGTYSLPAGNPVVTGEVISSSWANTTLSDIAAAMTDSLARSGQGGMLAALDLFDGTIGSPGLAWSTESTSGLYRAGAGDFRWVIGGADRLTITSALVTISPPLTVTGAFTANGAAVAAAGIRSTLSSLTTTNAGIFLDSANPWIVWRESDAAANNRLWGMSANAEQFVASAVLDDTSGPVNWIEVNRTLAAIDTVNFPNGILQYGGVEVGYKDLPIVTFSASRSVLATDRGRCLCYSGGAGQTLTTNNTIGVNGIITVVNESANNLTLGQSGVTITWINGTGVYPTGARTLAPGAIVTLWGRGASSIYVWGTGIS